MDVRCSRIGRGAVAMLTAVAVAVTCTGPALAKPPRDDIFDPVTLDYASCDNAVYGSDGADLITAEPGQSLTGLGGDDDLTAAARTFCLTGGDGNDKLTAQTTGDDGPWMDGGPGSDRLVGGPFADSLKGGPGDDVITGGAGRDVIDGGAGDDTIDGGAGPDRITGGAGHNRINGGSGNDLISANDGSRERIDCGPGNDVVHADRGDRLIGCEHVKVRSNPYVQETPRGGGLTTRFYVHFIVPHTTEIPANDEGNAGYDFTALVSPSPDCELVARDGNTTPFPRSGDTYKLYFRISPRRSRCRGTYKIAVTFENTSFGVECNSREGSKPRRPGDLSDCPFTDTIGYFTFRIR